MRYNILNISVPIRNQNFRLILQRILILTRMLSRLAIISAHHISSHLQSFALKYDIKHLFYCEIKQLCSLYSQLDFLSLLFPTKSMRIQICLQLGVKHSDSERILTALFDKMIFRNESYVKE